MGPESGSGDSTVRSDSGYLLKVELIIFAVALDVRGERKRQAGGTRRCGSSRGSVTSASSPFSAAIAEDHGRGDSERKVYFSELWELESPICGICEGHFCPRRLV